MNQIVFLQTIPPGQNLLNAISASDSATREPCQICLSGTFCEVVETDFEREEMEKGYNYLATIPSGACNVSVMEKTETKNHLALRWTGGFFNGGWMIKKSGNYSAGGNSFQYKRPDSSQDDGDTTEYIKFTSQLSLGIHVYLIVKSSNLGVKFNYVLPPIKNSQEGLTKVNTQTVEQATVEPKRVSDENEAGVEPHEDYRGKQQGSKRGEQSYAPYLLGRQNGDGSSAPSWIQDLNKMLLKWKEELDKQIKESQRLWGRIIKAESK